MKIVIITTYDKVTPSWLAWYAGEIAKQGNIPAAQGLLNVGQFSFASKDPSSDVIATTSYRVFPDPSPALPPAPPTPILKDDGTPQDRD